MGKSTIWHENTIQKNAVAVACSACYGGDARLIRIPIEWVQGKKITVQYNSNHAWPSTIFKHKPSFLRLSLDRSVQSNDTSPLYGWFRQTMVQFWSEKIENWPRFACFHGPTDIFGWFGRVPVVLQVKAPRETATTRGKTTTIAAVASAAAAP